MRKKALLLAVAAVLSGCVDRGQCLAGHTEHHPDQSYWTTTLVSNGNGGMTTQMQFVPVPEYDSYECDQWEFPNGRPKPTNKK